MAYRWPGNVRELQNVIRNVVVLHQGNAVTRDMLPAGLVEEAPASELDVVSEPGRPETPRFERETDIAALSRAIRPLAEVEREAIEAAVERCGGDVRKAAVLLGIAPATVYRRLRVWRGDETPGAGRALLRAGEPPAHHFASQFETIPATGQPPPPATAPRHAAIGGVFRRFGFEPPLGTLPA